MNFNFFKFNLIFLISAFSFFHLNASIFDGICWKFERTRKKINLYCQLDKDNGLNYYKAEIILKNADIDKIINNIHDFPSYKYIFAGSEYFKVVKKINENEFILNAELNFFPYKNRTYFVTCMTEKIVADDEDVYSVEWCPVLNNPYTDKDKQNPKALLIKKVNGKWLVKKMKDNRIYIALHYYNDWETNLPISWVQNVEKQITMKNLQQLVDYSK